MDHHAIFLLSWLLYLGTKLHQHTRKAIAKRKPALMTAIRKFNLYCATLEELSDPAWSIPLPQPLPTELTNLRNCNHLMEDVWIHPSSGDVPRWLEDLDVRDGIRAMLKLDRCSEERRRLGREADNMCRWFGQELTAIELALRTPSCTLLQPTFLGVSNLLTDHHLVVLLQQRCDRLLHLKTHWTNPLSSSLRFESHIDNATRVAQRLSGASTSVSLRWVIPVVLTNSPIEIEESVSSTGPPPAVFTFDSDETIVADILAADHQSDIDHPLDTDTRAEDVDAEIVWELPVGSFFNISVTVLNTPADKPPNRP